jgi:monoamine oxidase
VLKEGTLLLKEPVDSIVQTDNNVTVVTANGKQIKTKYVVLACSPVMTGKIKYSPPLPSARDELSQRYFMGRVIKCLAFYKEAFWIKKGLSGEILSEDDIITMGFEATLYDNSKPSLVAFVCGDHARKLSALSEEDRKSEILKCFAKFFGPEALSPINYLDKDWTNEPWYTHIYIIICYLTFPY